MAALLVDERLGTEDDARAVPEVKFNAVEPGYTATELGGSVPAKKRGGRSVEISARNIVRMATIGPDGPTGTFQEDDGELRWERMRSKPAASGSLAERLDTRNA
jgi:hypothetical protein